MSAIVTEQLVKEYRGRIRALKGVSIKVEKGEIFGLLGQNGAGKTTLIKILLGILSPTEGAASLLGEPVGRTGIRKKVGYLPEDHRFPDYHTADSLLQLYGSLLEMKSSRIKERADEVLDIVGLKGRRSYKIRTYSKGMKQRLGIAQAIMHEPEVIFLDEPTDGVDPVGRKEIRALLNELKGRGATIFINSHLLGEVELICDRVVILDQGEIIRQGSIVELTQSKGTFIIGLALGEDLPDEEARALGFNAEPTPEGRWELNLREGQSLDPLLDLLREKGLHLRHLIEKRQTLEDLFVQTVEAVEPGLDARRRQPRRPARP